MIYHAVEELQMRRALVTLKMIADHLKRFYPIEKNLDILKTELKEKLDHAVSIGRLARCRHDAYCLSTFRQEAYNQKTDLTSFWERYYKVFFSIYHHTYFQFNRQFITKEFSFSLQKRPGRRLKSTNTQSNKKSEFQNQYQYYSDNSSDDFTDDEDF